MDWAEPAIRVAAAGLGAAVGGPLGGAIGVWVAPALGTAAAELIGERAKKFGEEAGKKLIDVGSDSLGERLKKKSVDLKAVYCQALRASLTEIQYRAGMGYEDWYANWNRSLGASGHLKLPALDEGDITPERLDVLFRSTMENLDAQGEAMVRKSQSLVLETRSMPEPLLGDLTRFLPERLAENFRVLLVQPEHEEAWREAQVEFASYARTVLANIDRKTDLLPRMDEKIDRLTQIMVEGFFQSAEREGRITEQLLKDKDAEIARLTRDLQEIRAKAEARSSEPDEAKLAALLDAGDLAGALALKTSQVERRQAESAKLPQDLFELGTIHELRFDWVKALDAYREAWRLEPSTERAFKYGFLAQRQNHHAEAISIYKSLLANLTEPVHIATTLNNLGILYSDTKQLVESEQAFLEALSIRRELAQENPKTYLPDVAGTLNNLGNLYRHMQRLQDAENRYLESLSVRRRLAGEMPEAYLLDLAMALNNLGVLYSDMGQLQESEGAYLESLSILRTLSERKPEALRPDVARILNNLGNVYRRTERLQEAERKYLESLSIRRKLSKGNPEAYLPDLATTLNDLGVLYGDMRQLQESEGAYLESLAIRRKLSEGSPAAYLPGMARALNNLGNLYRRAQRLQKAEETYLESLSLRRKLSEENPEAFLPDVATTLFNLGILYSDTMRSRNSEESYLESLSIRRKLAERNPKVYLPDVAKTLNNLGNLYRNARRMQESEESWNEAERILEPLWQAAPKAHGDAMATILVGKSSLLGPEEDEEALALLQRALAAAFASSLRSTIQSAIDERGRS